MRGLIFLAGSIVGGLALAFLVVMVRPDLIRRDAPAIAASPIFAGPRPSLPAPARVTYAAAVERAAPSVVNVYTARLVTERVAPSSLGELFGGFLPRYRQRIERSLGSGVIVDDAGHIVTNHHVIANADSVRVQLADGRIADAHIVGRDPDTDLAVLKIDLTPLPIAVLGRSDLLKVGDVVLAIGNPVGLSQTVTHGIVSATSRQQLGIAALEDFIQTDAPINFGNSGGALIDSSGTLVGINTAIVAKNLGVEGIGFAIPVNMVRGVVSDIIANGRVIRGWIGIVPEDVSNEQAAQYGLAQGGVLIANLYVGSPAQQAGLQPGDLVLAIDSAPVRGAQDTLGRIATHKPGSRIAIHGKRAGKEFDVHAQVSERPPEQLSSPMTIIAMRRFASNAEFDAALVERLERAISAPGAANTAVMLSGGRTPLPTYREVAVRKPAPAQGLHLLFSDDRYVPSTSESSNYFQTRLLVDALDVPVARVRTELPLEQAASDYGRQLAALFDSGIKITLGLLGLGADGHTASLFNANQLAEARGKLAIAVQRPDGLQGISVTPEVLSHVAEPLFLVTGADKHAIVEDFLKSDSHTIARLAVAGCPKAEIWVAS